jgi:FAD/FMN-containing dehydrogenase
METRMNLTESMLKIYQSNVDTVKQLRSRLLGEVITPFDTNYEEASQAWNLAVVQHPAVIVAARSTGDVADAVQFARQHGLGIAVQSTGHGVSLEADGALLILTAGLNELRIDAKQQRATIGAGLMWGEVLEKTQAVGLAPLLGSSPGVGVTGYTLGGGIGWLARKYGLAADSVISFVVVNADGVTLRASREENSELFWGLRGGGGGLGIVTAMEIRLYPVSQIYGGNLVYPASLAKEVMLRYREWVRTTPEELTSSVVLMNFPPLPQLPEMLRGQSFVMVRGAYSGPVEQGEALLRSWREWQTPLMDEFKVMSFRDAGKVSNDPVDPLPSNGSGGWMRELSDAAIDTLIRYALPQDAPPLLTMVEVRHVEGKMAREENPGSFSHRDAPLLLFAMGFTPGAAIYEQLGVYLGEMKAELAPALTGGEYLNILHGHEAREKAHAGFSEEAFQRLQALKKKVDPQNVFPFGFNY